MAKGQKPDYGVFVSRQSNGKAYYNRVGAAWRVGQDGISIQLDCLPVDGKCVLFPPKEDDETERR